MPSQLPLRQGSLWERDCHTCLAYDQCGGTSTAPCTCVHVGARQHDCANCSILCTERRIGRPSGRLADSFFVRLKEGLPLKALRLRQPPIEFPSLILSRTDSLPRDIRLPDAWVGVHLRTLLPLIRAEPVGKESAWELRSRLRASKDARLIGILNGDDDLLESLWRIDRRNVFRQLHTARIEAVTGPTFSVSAEDGANPASHNVVMLLRHHRFCAEASAAGLHVIPNLYWRSREDRADWVSWLRRNSEVTVVARDFSRTKQRAPFRPEFDGLLDILKGVPRQTTVLITGIAEEKMSDTRRALHRVGASVCFVSPRVAVAPPASNGGGSCNTNRAEDFLRQIDAFRALADGSVEETSGG